VYGDVRRCGADVRRVQQRQSQRLQVVCKCNAIVAVHIVGPCPFLGTHVTAILRLSSLSYNVPLLVCHYEQFEHDAETVRNSAYFQLEAAVEASEGLSRSVTASAMASGSDWPFVTYMNYELAARQYVRGAGVGSMAFLPLLKTLQDKESWGFYSTSNQGWIDRSFEIDREPRPSNASIRMTMFRFEDDASGEGTRVDDDFDAEYPSSPVWEISPPPSDPASVVNFNPLSATWFRSTFDAMISSNEAALGDATPAVSLLNLTYKEPGDGESKLLPYSTVLSPIFDTEDAATRSVVGLIWTIVRWDKYLGYHLGTDIKGVQCVFKNTCDGETESYTYQVVGKEVSFLGTGDLHEGYDSYQYAFDLSPTASKSSEEPDSSRCVYAFYLYPTTEFESLYTGSPLSAAIAVGALCLVVACFFLLYDFFVGRKNEKIINIAAKSNNVLSTLFPANVRDRLLAEQDEQLNKKLTLDDHLKTALRGQNGLDESENDGDDEAIFNSKPIADLFTDATILVSPLCLLHDLESHSTSSHLLTSNLSHLLHPSTNLPI